LNPRELICLTGGVAFAEAPVARAQQPIMSGIGFLALATERDSQPFIEAFRSGLAALGYTEGKNIRVLYRFAYGNADRLSALTLELVSLGSIR
jgi:putative tryptophan/tyrosine transport system substrate-binding protein